jgi:hypothetical protein
MLFRRLVHAAAVTLLAAGAAAGQTSPTKVPGDWRRLPGEPRVASRESRCSALGDVEWQVAIAGGTLTASRLERNREPARDPVPYELDFQHAIDEPPPAPPSPVTGVQGESSAVWAERYGRYFAARRVVPVSDGWLVGFQGGEYGGSLWWYPTTAGPGKRLWDHNVQAIEPLGEAGTYVVLSGSDYVRPDGSVLWVRRDENGWNIFRRSTLDGEAWAQASHPQGLAVVTRRSVSLVAADGTVTRLATASSLALPTSMAVGPSGEIAVGRRLMVSLFRPAASFREELYIPSACRQFTVSDLTCSCRDGR